MNDNTSTPQKDTVFSRVKDTVTNLTRTQIIGGLAVINLLLLFSAWLYIPIFASLSDAPVIGNAVSPYVNLSETAFSIESTVNKAESTFNKIVDTFEVKEEQAEKGQKLITEINLVSSILGVDLKEYGISLDDIKIEEGNLLFNDQDVIMIRETFATVNAIVGPVSSAIIGVIILCFCFDLYAVITAFKKKKVTVGSFIAFIIQGVIILAIFFTCYGINTTVQKEIFFINKTVTPSFWAWIILVVSIIGFILSLKEYRGTKAIVDPIAETTDDVVKAVKNPTDLSDRNTEEMVESKMTEAIDQDTKQ